MFDGRLHDQVSRSKSSVGLEKADLQNVQSLPRHQAELRRNGVAAMLEQVDSTRAEPGELTAQTLIEGLSRWIEPDCGTRSIGALPSRLLDIQEFFESIIQA